MAIVTNFGDFKPTNESTESKHLYWNGIGKHQEEYDNLYAELVGNSGSSETLNGELIRAASRLYHENFNNGNCNAKSDNYDDCSHCSGSGEVEAQSYDDDEEDAGYEECPECWGEGKIEDDAEVSEFYAKFLDIIEENVPEARRTIDAVRNIITTGNGDESAYDTLIDQVVEHVLKSEDQPLPEGYERD